MNTSNLIIKLSIKTLMFFTKYFGLEYPLPKLDLIALQDVEIGKNEFNSTTVIP